MTLPEARRTFGELMKAAREGRPYSKARLTQARQVLRRAKRPAMNRKKLTRSKARKILHERQVRGYPLTARQRRFFGARASGYPKRSEKNPQRLLQRLGRTTEIRYRRDVGSKRGFYKHEFRTARANLYTVSAGWVYVPGKSIVITEGKPHV